MQIIKRKKDNSKDKKRINRIFSILHFFLDMEAATNPNNTNTFPYCLPLHIYKSILLFIWGVIQPLVICSKSFANNRVSHTAYRIVIVRISYPHKQF